MAKAVDSMLSWLQQATLTELCQQHIDFQAVKDAIQRSNYWTERRLCGSISVKYKMTVDLKDDWQSLNYHIHQNTYVVSMSPELSLAQSNMEIPVVELPLAEDCPCPSNQELG